MRTLSAVISATLPVAQVRDGADDFGEVGRQATHVAGSRAGGTNRQVDIALSNYFAEILRKSALERLPILLPCRLFAHRRE